MLLFVVDADAGVTDGEGDDRRRRGEGVAVEAPPARGQADLDADHAAFGEFEGVGEEVLQDLAEPLGIGDDRGRRVGGDDHRIVDALVLRHRLEFAEQRDRKIAQREIRRLRRDGAGLGLGQVEDAVEQAHQVLARRADDAGVLDLGVGHVVLGVVLELLGQDEEAVQRSA